MATSGPLTSAARREAELRAISGQVPMQFSPGVGRGRRIAGNGLPEQPKTPPSLSTGSFGRVGLPLTRPPRAADSLLRGDPEQLESPWIGYHYGKDLTLVGDLTRSDIEMRMASASTDFTNFVHHPDGYRSTFPTMDRFLCREGHEVFQGEIDPGKHCEICFEAFEFEASYACAQCDKLFCPRCIQVAQPISKNEDQWLGSSQDMAEKRKAAEKRRDQARKDREEVAPEAEVAAGTMKMSKLKGSTLCAVVTKILGAPVCRAEIYEEALTEFGDVDIPAVSAKTVVRAGSLVMVDKMEDENGLLAGFRTTGMAGVTWLPGIKVGEEIQGCELAPPREWLQRTVVWKDYLTWTEQYIQRGEQENRDPAEVEAEATVEMYLAHLDGLVENSANREEFEQHVNGIREHLATMAECLPLREARLVLVVGKHVYALPGNFSRDRNACSVAVAGRITVQSDNAHGMLTGIVATIVDERLSQYDYSLRDECALFELLKSIVGEQILDPEGACRAKIYLHDLEHMASKLNNSQSDWYAMAQRVGCSFHMVAGRVSLYSAKEVEMCNKMGAMLLKKDSDVTLVMLGEYLRSVGAVVSQIRHCEGRMIAIAPNAPKDMQNSLDAAASFAASFKSASLVLIDEGVTCAEVRYNLNSVTATKKVAHAGTAIQVRRRIEIQDTSHEQTRQNTVRALNARLDIEAHKYGGPLFAGMVEYQVMSALDPDDEREPWQLTMTRGKVAAASPYSIYAESGHMQTILFALDKGSSQVAQGMVNLRRGLRAGADVKEIRSAIVEMKSVFGTDEVPGIELPCQGGKTVLVTFCTKEGSEANKLSLRSDEEGAVLAVEIATTPAQVSEALNVRDTDVKLDRYGRAVVVRLLLGTVVQAGNALQGSVLASLGPLLNAWEGHNWLFASSTLDRIAAAIDGKDVTAESILETLVGREATAICAGRLPSTVAGLRAFIAHKGDIIEKLKGEDGLQLAKEAYRKNISAIKFAQGCGVANFGKELSGVAALNKQINFMKQLGGTGLRFEQAGRMAGVRQAPSSDGGSAGGGQTSGAPSWASGALDTFARGR